MKHARLPLSQDRQQEPAKAKRLVRPSGFAELCLSVSSFRAVHSPLSSLSGYKLPELFRIFSPPHIFSSPPFNFHLVLVSPPPRPPRPRARFVIVATALLPARLAPAPNLSLFYPLSVSFFDFLFPPVRLGLRTFRPPVTNGTRRNSSARFSLHFRFFCTLAALRTVFLFFLEA